MVTIKEPGTSQGVTTALTPLSSSLAPRPFEPFDLPSQRQVFEAFLEGRSPATRRAYETDLKDFATFIGSLTTAGNPDPEGAVLRLLSSDQGGANGKVLEYRNHLRTRGLSPATANRRLATLRSMVKLARMLGQIPWTLDVEGLDARAYRDTAGPGIDTLTKLIAAIEQRQDMKGGRDMAIVRLLFDLGLRRGEIAELNVEHLSKRGISVLGKKRLERETLVLPFVTRVAIESWLTIRPSTESKAMFVSLDPGKYERLTGNGIYVMLATWAKSIEETIRPHGVRHTAITNVLVVTNGNLQEAAKFARHRNVNTTMIYDDARKNNTGETATRLADLIPGTAGSVGTISDPEALLTLIPEEKKPKVKLSKGKKTWTSILLGSEEK